MSAPSLFLTLPPELRDSIYRHILEDEDTFRLTAPGSTTSFISHQKIAGTCHQIRQEYLDVLKNRALSPQHDISIQVSIIDMNFTPLISLMESSTPRELNALKKTSRMRLDLVISPHGKANGQSLAYWSGLVRHYELSLDYRIDASRSASLLPPSWKGTFCDGCDCESRKLGVGINAYYGFVRLLFPC